jgi:hypothetical protein
MIFITKMCSYIASFNNIKVQGIIIMDNGGGTEIKSSPVTGL